MRRFQSFDSYDPERTLIDAAAWSLPTDTWVLFRRGAWFHCQPRSTLLPESGWKFHVSTTPHDATKVHQLVVWKLRDEAVPFKFLLDIPLLVHSMSKLYDRAAAGKFMTIYPKDEDQFLEIGQTLVALLQPFDGPYIVSDRQYPGTRCLYFRYGAVLPKEDEAPQYILRPDGGHDPDPRGVRFARPQWADFPDIPGLDTDLLESAPPTTVALADGRYEVRSSLSSTPCSGVYMAVSTVGGHHTDQVIIKEGRRLMGWSNGYTQHAADRCKREYDIMSTLATTGVTAKPVDFFTQAGNSYLVEEYIDGYPLGEFAARNWAPVIVSKYSNHWPASKLFADKLHAVWRLLLTYLETVHGMG